MKKLLPLARFPQTLKEFRFLYNDPKLRKQLDDLKTKVLFLPEIPKICYESQSRAIDRLIMQAWGVKEKPGGDSAWGEIPVDAQQWLLSEVKAKGTARGTFLLQILHNLSDRNSPDFDENGLDRFLIKLGNALSKLGNALSDKSNRRELPDWENGVTPLKRYIAHGCWCYPITVDGERWPPLCVLSAPVLAKFLTLCKKPLWRKTKGTNEPENPRTLEQEIRRLGLKRIPKGRLMQVEKRFGVFRFG